MKRTLPPHHLTGPRRRHVVALVLLLAAVTGGALYVGVPWWFLAVGLAAVGCGFGLAALIANHSAPASIGGGLPEREAVSR